MSKAIRFYQTGGPEVLKLESVDGVGEPGPGQARVRHTFIAVNFIDIYFRSGRYRCTTQRLGLRCRRSLSRLLART
jgi:NADPH2:quinone reductase